MITMTRRVTFSAGKVDWPVGAAADGSAQPDGEEPQVYGHNYLLDVTVSGKIDPSTGIIVNIKEIDRVVRERVIDRLDRKSIHRQAAEFCGWPITPESLAAWIADMLQSSLPAEVTLTAVRLEETPLLAAEWTAGVLETMKNENRTDFRTGKGDPESAADAQNDAADTQPKAALMRSTRVYEFAASHRLHSAHLTDEENFALFGKCNYANGHGHNYILEVTVEGPLDPRSARVIDPDVLDEIVNREVVDRYDHRHFNYDIPEFKDLVPSTEVVTKVIWERLVGEVPKPARLASVLIRETARNFFEYRGEA